MKVWKQTEIQQQDRHSKRQPQLQGRDLKPQAEHTEDKDDFERAAACLEGWVEREKQDWEPDEQLQTGAQGALAKGAGLAKGAKHREQQKLESTTATTRVAHQMAAAERCKP